jgi:membrane dipeptidase
MLLFDAHLDLAMNAMEWNRDLSQPIDQIRLRERGLTDKPDRGRNTVCFPEMRRGGVGLCVATLIARFVKPPNRLPGWNSPAQAWAHTQGQLAWYRTMEQSGELVQITRPETLRAHLKLWEHKSTGSVSGANSSSEFNKTNPTGPPIGYILSLEGADSIVELSYLERAYAQGLRAVGLAHYGPGTYAQGTDASGGLGRKGRELLMEMERLGIILDVTHLSEDSFWEALKLFKGSVWASHCNCRALVPHHRQLSDDQLKALLERKAIIGVALDAWMLVPGWIRKSSTPEGTGLKLNRLVDHIDHVCQLAGNARHVGIGSDLDGGFGLEQTPADLRTIADLARLPELLARRDYSQEDVRRIAHGNFVDFLLQQL